MGWMEMVVALVKGTYLSIADSNEFEIPGDDGDIEQLIDAIHAARRGYEQEGYIVLQNGVPGVNGKWKLKNVLLNIK